MAGEIKLSWDDIFLEGDISYLDSGDLETEQGFMSALIISLFTDRRAREDDNLPDENNPDRKGWWGDLASPEAEGDQIGSKLWLLFRSKTLPSVLQKAKQYVEEALQWLIDDGYATKIEVETERQGIPGNDRLAIAVRVYLVSGSSKVIKLSSTGGSTINLSYLMMGGDTIIVLGAED